MNKHPFQPKKGLVHLSLIIGTVALLGLTGCKTDVVHQRSISELNEKAQSMMQAGDYEGAISRLEAAHDLEPSEPNTTYNLAVAYQTKGDYPKAIAIFNELLQNPGPDGSPMSAAQIHKDLGITYEAQADKLEAEASNAEAAAKGKKTANEQMTHDADMALQQAVMHYKKALPGIKDSAEISQQIQAIEAKLKKSSAGAQP